MKLAKMKLKELTKSSPNKVESSNKENTNNVIKIFAIKLTKIITNKYRESHLLKSIDLQHDESLYLEDFIRYNTLGRIDKLISVSTEGLEIHYLAHIIKYFLSKNQIYYNISFDAIETNNSSKEYLGQYDETFFIYDIYLMYLYGIELDENMFSKEFLLNRADYMEWHTSIFYLSTLQRNIDYLNIKGIVKDSLSSIDENDLNNIRILEQVSDLLGLINTGFKGNFEIKSEIADILSLTSEKYGSDEIMETKLGTFILPIIYKIFGDRKSIEITKDNYEEIKKEFQRARTEFLTSQGIENHKDQKKIREKVNDKIERLSKINDSGKSRLLINTIKNNK